ncbi:Fasciclin-like arabinogalactan protein 11 [Morella rubra]|uniref:Fasciclin-like arabinogalactan protein 11 n=1 Tax=Morella rubra TaxID=262757 RepID=A0A6A1WF88_9ROSI|nr:Fasciclin-like arabinogalactan protein 11 [Morella rubra]
MKQVLLVPFLLFWIFFVLHSTTTSAQSPAQSPAAPSGPSDILSILKKAGHFTTFIRLLKNTDMAEQINGQLKKNSLGLTIFAPPDSCFSNLKLGTLNSLTDKQQLQLVQFHILPSFYSILQLQTATNPVHTLAGDSNDGHFQLNVTSSSGEQVNLTTGIVSATAADTIYTDNSQLAVYRVDQVLLPLEIFGSPSPPPSKPKQSAATTASTSETSGLIGPNLPQTAISLGVAVGAMFSFWL